MNPQENETIAGFLLSLVESEVPVTIGVFGAVPNGRLDYRPDAVSKTALGLLRHIALEDEWFLNAIADGQFAPVPDDSDACGIMTPADAIARYQERMPAAIARVRALSGEDLERQIDLLGAFQTSALGFLSMMLRHSVHHRGQLSTYLRAMGGKVPGIYGPSADTAMPVPA
jgi:uncharacterized damage-inducible protein DinB